MSIEFKLSVSLLIIGISNLLLRGNRNWIFGYRSSHAIRTHKSYAYANTIYGAGMTLIGGIYLIVITWFPRQFKLLTQVEHVLIMVGYLVLLFLVIELRLRKVFKDNPKG